VAVKKHYKIVSHVRAGNGPAYLEFEPNAGVNTVAPISTIISLIEQTKNEWFRKEQPSGRNLTSVERIGRKEGRMESTREALQNILKIRYNRIPKRLGDLIKSLNERSMGYER
jgi:hypothetical protein